MWLNSAGIRGLRQYYVFLLVVVILVKMCISLFGGLQYDVDSQRLVHIEWDWKKDFSAQVPPDDYGISQTALYYSESKVFLTGDTYGLPSATGQLRKTAFRPKFNVFLHLAGVRVFNKLNSRTPLRHAQHMHAGHPVARRYMYWVGFWAAVIQCIFYTASVFAFWRMSRYFLAENHARICTLLYATYPSVFLFMETTLSEKIAGPIVVLFVAYFLDALHKPMPFWKNAACVGLATLACLMRPHLLVIWLVLLGLYTGLFLVRYWRQREAYKATSLAILLASGILLAHLPVFYLHHKDFGKPFLSSQSSLEFFQGHNWYARGSWYPAIWKMHGPDLVKRFDADPATLRFADEKQELDFYGRQAWKFIRENPGRELELVARKTAIYLLPYNFMNHRPNLYLLFTHLGIIGFIFFAMHRFFASHTAPATRMEYAVVLAPVLACYLITLVFFVGERWRFYAEPFMLLLGYVFYQRMFSKIARLEKAAKTDG